MASGPADVPTARLVAIASACRGPKIAVDAATLEDDNWACACQEREKTPRGMRAGSWCGLPQPNETRDGELSATAERDRLAPGEGTRVLVRLRNTGTKAATYRMATRHLWARLVGADGAPFNDAAHASGSYNDEALFELPPGGTFEIWIPVRGTYARFAGTSPTGAAEAAPLLPGKYAIQVFVGGLAGEGSRLVPIEVR